MGERVVVITGASAGIGAALAEDLASRGTALTLVARDTKRLGEVAKRCGGRVLAVGADVTRREEVKRVVRDSLEHHGQVDVWVNNAGRGITRQPSELTDEDLDEMMSVNVKSALYGMQEILPHFQERGRGHVINVSSLLGRVPYATFRSAYCGAKHFLNALTATFRDEVQATHPQIEFTLVSPGVVRTDFGLSSLHGGPDSREMPNSQSAEEVARVIAWAIDARLPDVYTRRGSAARIASYYQSVGVDGDPEATIAGPVGD